MVLDVFVQPRSSRNGLAGVHDGALKLTVTAAPADNKANKAVCELLAGILGVPKRNISLVAGKTSRRKKISVAGIKEGEVKAYVNNEIGKK